MKIIFKEKPETELSGNLKNKYGSAMENEGRI